MVGDGEGLASLGGDGSVGDVDAGLGQGNGSEGSAGDEREEAHVDGVWVVVGFVFWWLED